MLSADRIWVWKLSVFALVNLWLAYKEFQSLVQAMDLFLEACVCSADQNWLVNLYHKSSGNLKCMPVLCTNFHCNKLT